MAYQDLRERDAAVEGEQASRGATIAKVSRRETFNAAHQLYDPARSDEENERLFGKCVRLHGHNYVLEVVVAGEIQAGTGYVLDLKHLSDVIQRRVIQDVDHRNLNRDVPWLRGADPDRRESGPRLLGEDPLRATRGPVAHGSALGDRQELGRSW